MLVQTHSNAIRPEMSAEEHAVWRELVVERWGLDFAESRQRTLARGVWQRACQLGFKGYDDYQRFLTLYPRAAGEWDALVELLVNSETSFFRHEPSFASLRGLLPELMTARQSARAGSVAHTLTLWSAGCATGQEAYSLAMTALDVTAGSRLQVRVYGSDLSASALAQARAGRYRENRAANLSPELRRRYFVRSEDEGKVFLALREEVKARMQWERANLADPTTCGVRGADVIFCQNVLLYFRQPLRQTVVAQLGQRLNVGGYLFLAPGEVVGLRVPGLEAVPAENALILKRTTPQAVRELSREL